MLCGKFLAFARAVGVRRSALAFCGFVLHPALADVYVSKIKALASSLDDEATKAEAIELLRSLVAEVRLHPDDDAPDGHVIELYGELATILELSGPTNDEPRRITGGVSVSLVAGVGFEPTTFRL